MIYSLEIRFSLLNRKNKLVFAAIIRDATKKIEGSTVYSALSMIICKGKSLYINMSII